MNDTCLHVPEIDTHLLTDIGLPKETALYLGGGVPQMFRHVTDMVLDDEAWLYLPFGLLRSELMPADSTPADPASVAVCGNIIPIEEGRMLLPLRVADRIVAVLAGEFDESTPNEPYVTELLRLITHLELCRYTRDSTPLRQRLTELLEPYVTADRFSRNVLNTLIEQVPDGLAALYDESEGLYRLRTAVGNIAMWDVLDGALTLSQASRWLNAIRIGQHYLSAGFLPEHPTFLSTPPAFLFVHPGLKCSASSRLLAMPVTGDISRNTGDNVGIVAAFAAMLHEDQFGAVEEIHAICGRLRSPRQEDRSFDEMLSEIFDLVSARTGLSRLIYVHDNGHASAVIQRAHARPAVRKETPPSIARVVLEASRAGRFLLEQAAEPGLLSEDEAKRYYLDNVRAELCFKLPGTADSDACIAFGTPGNSDLLRRHERMLEVVAMVLHLYRRLQGGEPSVALQHTIGEKPHTPGNRRTVTAYRLMEGYFHSAFDSLAYVIGQSELAAASDTSRPSGIGPIIEAGRTVADELERIRTITRDTARADTERVSVNKILRNMPAIFEGYIHFLQDRKNIALRITVGPRHARNQQINSADVYDDLYPAILAILEEAICSGAVNVTATSIDTADAVMIECPAEMIGHSSAAEILQNLYPGAGNEVVGENRIIIDCGGTHWICELSDSPIQRAWFAFNRLKKPVRRRTLAETPKRKPEVG